MNNNSISRRNYKVCNGCSELTQCVQATETRRKCYQNWYNRNQRDAESEKLRLALFRHKKFANWMLCRCKSVALKNGVDFDLDLDWFKTELEKGMCAATDIEFVLPVYQRGARGKRGPWTPSVDRIDNKQGYLKSNCRLVVWIFNLAKSNYKEADINRLCNEYVNKENRRRHSVHEQQKLTEIPVHIIHTKVVLGGRQKSCVH